MVLEMFLYCNCSQHFAC